MLNRLRRALAALMHRLGSAAHLIADRVSPAPKQGFSLSVAGTNRDRHLTVDDVKKWAEAIGPKTA